MSLTKEECEESLYELSLITAKDTEDGSCLGCSCTSCLPNDECLNGKLIGTFNKLIKEHFELKEKYSKILDDVHDYRYEVYAMKMTIRNLCKYFGVKNEEELKNIYLNPPLKFEELKPNMLVYDKKFKFFFAIFEIHEEDKSIEIMVVDKQLPYFKVITLGTFEENRFYRKQVEE